MIKFRTYTGKEKADFYVQRHGENAGRPTKQPIRNCFAVYSNYNHAFELFYCLYKAQVFKKYLHGTAQRFINSRNLEEILRIYYREDYNPTKLKAVHEINKLLDIEAKKLVLLHEMQITLAKSIL